MDLETFAVLTGIGKNGYDILLPVWDEVTNHCTTDLPEFMEEEFFLRYYAYTKGPDTVRERFRAVRKVCEAKPEARLAANLLHWLLFRRKPMYSAVNQLPHLEKLFGENAGIFNLAVALSAYPLIRETYDRMGLPPKYWEGLFGWLDGARQIYEQRSGGIPGFTLSQIHWIRNYEDGRLFRIGRLEFMLQPPSGALCPLFRNRTDGKLVMLMRSGIPLDEKGETPAEGTEQPFFTSRLVYQDHAYTGTPVLPDGTCLIHETRTLSEKEWEPVWNSFDTVPGIHIPGGGHMTPDSLRASFLEAREFFPKYCGFELKAVSCSSWIFHPDWEKVMPDSNMVKFRSEGWAFPSGAAAKNRTTGIFFAFGVDRIDPETHPCRTSLQRKIAEFLRNGGGMVSGGWLMLAEHFDEYGTQYYRRTCGKQQEEKQHGF